MAEETKKNNNIVNDAENVVKDIVTDKATKTVTEAVTSTATEAAASGGTLTIPAAVKNLIKLLAQKVKDETNSIWEIEEPDSHIGMIGIIIVLLFFLLIIPTIISLIPAAVMYYPNMLLRDAKQFVQDGTETIYTSFTDKGKFFKEVLEVDHYNLETNDIVNESRQIDEQNIEIFKAIIDEAIYQSFETYAKQYIVLPSFMESLGKKLDSIEGIFNITFDTDGALDNYRSNPYPYTLMHSQFSYYTIGDFLDGKIPEAELNNDLNYAEIISVLCQKEEFSTQTFTYSEFYDLLTSETVSELLFEIQLSDDYEYEIYTEEIDNPAYVEPEDPANTPSNGQLPGGNENNTQDNSSITNPTIKPPSNIGELPDNNQDQVPGKSDSAVKPPSNKDQTNTGGGNTTQDKTEISKPVVIPPSKLDQMPDDLIPIIKPSLKSGQIDNRILNSIYVIDKKQVMIAKRYSNNTVSSIGKINQMPDTPVVNPKIEIECVKYYYKSQVKPYGLIELYQIAEISPTAPNVNHPTMTNYELLNDNEIWLRARLPETDLGPSFQDDRSEKSVVYNTMKNAGVKPTGRSMTWYLENSLNLDGTIGHYIAEEWREIEYCKPSYIPIGASIILDMPQYINQGNYPNDYRGTDGNGDTIKKAGCIDCSYAMCLAYYSRIATNICNISKTYVKNNAFDSNTFLSDNGLTQKWNEPFNLSTITDYLTCGYPVILHIEGIWEYEETVNREIDGVLRQEKVQRQYHTTTNGHFLVIIGFDDQGLYVYDPGKSANNQRVIPYNAFKYVDGKYIRPIIPNSSEYRPTYKINTFTSEDE